MALQLNTAIQTEHGFEVPSAYVRVTAVDGPKGDSILVVLDYYSNEIAFEANSLTLSVGTLEKGLQVPYDRTKDGVDILAYAHQEAVKYFTSVGIDATILLDSLI